jgi:hypothetical protein
MLPFPILIKRQLPIALVFFNITPAVHNKDNRNHRFGFHR